MDQPSTHFIKEFQNPNELDGTILIDKCYGVTMPRTFDNYYSVTEGKVESWANWDILDDPVQPLEHAEHSMSRPARSVSLSDQSMIEQARSMSAPGSSGIDPCV